MLAGPWLLVLLPGRLLLGALGREGLLYAWTWLEALPLGIAAASILAKVRRDRMMVELDRRYPQYGFAAHKGYPTESHREAIRKQGPCEIHRRSFNLLPERWLFD